MEFHLAEMANIFKLLSDETRLKIIVGLQAGAKPVAKLAQETELAQALVSYHLRYLRQANLVKCVKHGRERIYSLTDEHVEQLLAMLNTHIKEAA